MYVAFLGVNYWSLIKNNLKGKKVRQKEVFFYMNFTNKVKWKHI